MGIDLRSRHERLHANIHRKAAAHAPQHMAQNRELLLMGLLEIVPNADAKCFLVREEHIAFRALSMIDHDVDHIAGLHAHCASRILKLFDGNEAFGLVPEVYDYFLGSDFEDSPLKDFSL